MELRPYQQRAVEFLRNRQRGFIIAPAGSGKTIMAAVAMAEALRGVKAPAKGLVLANTVEQCTQMADALAVVDGPADADIDIRCAAGAPDAAGVDCLVCDEAQHSTAKSWMEILEQAPRFVFGFSATPFLGDPERDAELVAFYGGRENFFEISRGEVMAGGHLVKARVVFHDLDVAGEFNAEIEARAKPEIEKRCRRFRDVARFEHERRVRFQLTNEIVQANGKRNTHAIATANAGIAAGRSVIVLVTSIEHGAVVQAGIQNSVQVFSKMGAKKRREALQAFKRGEIKCVVSTQLLDEGADFPVASELVMLSGGRSAGRATQRTGRVLRPHGGKEEGLIHDYSDRGAAMAHAQSKAREKTYRSLGYTVEFSRA